MNRIILKSLQDEDAATYCKFFRRILVSDADCFRISPNDVPRTEMPTRGLADSFTLGAFLDGGLIGVVSFARDGADRERLRHKGLLFRMAVAGDSRGLGVGRQLVQEVLARARKLPDIEQVLLTVVSGNTAARSLYEHFGFRQYGCEPRAIKAPFGYLDEVSMVLFLNDR